MPQDVSVIDRLQLVERIKYASCDSNKKGTGSVCVTTCIVCKDLHGRSRGQKNEQQNNEKTM